RHDSSIQCDTIQTLIIVLFLVHDVSTIIQYPIISDTKRHDILWMAHQHAFHWVVIIRIKEHIDMADFLWLPPAYFQLWILILQRGHPCIRCNRRTIHPGLDLLYTEWCQGRLNL